MKSKLLSVVDPTPVGSRHISVVGSGHVFSEWLDQITE